MGEWDEATLERQPTAEAMVRATLASMSDALATESAREAAARANGAGDIYEAEGRRAWANFLLNDDASGLSAEERTTAE